MSSRIRVAKAYVPVCDECGWFGHDWVVLGADRQASHDAREELDEHRRSDEHRRRAEARQQPPTEDS